MPSHDPETTDLAALTAHLRVRIGEVLAGELVGSSRLRTELVRHLRCSQLEAEKLIERLSAGRFIAKRQTRTGAYYWCIGRDEDGT